MAIVAFDALFFVRIVADDCHAAPFNRVRPMPPFPFSVSLDLALTGKGAPPKDGYDKALAAADKALDWLKSQPGKLELLSIPSRTEL